MTKDQRGGIRTAAVFVHKGSGLWRLDEDKRSVSYDPENGVIFQGATADESPGKDRKDWLPAEVSLFHPLQMRIWGASMDDWRIASAESKDRFARRSLVNTFDSDFTGYALVDLEFGVVVERLNGHP
ncbi:hypothetical protein [Arthrobacter sp. H20]|uniref:hypothetical protein n=1 Tax=Arthrobacter sp. H20 TaxID=1267981 RepID=UPI001C1E69CB|nr:hypothetical protein [Arthrobacter sp. H20]